MDEAPHSMDAATTMGAVGLIVADLNRSLAWYTGALGLHVQSRTPSQAWLGAGGPTLLVLTEQTGAHPVQRGRTGLYHVALLLPGRADLARVLRHLVATRTPLGGMADHGVSEALYLADPDGHGVEIYRDRPRAEWPTHDGALEMTLETLDVQGLLDELTSGRVTWHGMAEGTRDWPCAPARARFGRGRALLLRPAGLCADATLGGTGPLCSSRGLPSPHWP